MKKYIISATLITALIVFPIGWLLGNYFGLSLIQGTNKILTPLAEQVKEKKLPLLKYSLNQLSEYPYKASSIFVEEIIDGNNDYVSYLFSYQTLGKNMTGQLNIPTSPQPESGYPAIILLRGWVPAETYKTGTGTKSAAAVFAQNGYVTLAPDFFGYGESDEEVADSWEARFQKPITVIELLKTITLNPQIKVAGGEIQLSACECDHYLWAHSNGGQIALTVLEATQTQLKTSLWAPVSAPFPYSILFFSDEHDDEGKAMRAWLSIFEENYDVFEFSLTQHLDKLNASLQIHQGTADDAVPVAWNDEFVEKVKAENKRRVELETETKNATSSVDPYPELLPIEINYFKYPGADHNLSTAWNTAIQRDLEFFKSN